VTDDKQKNIDAARAKIREAASKGAQVIALPECWNCPYSNDSFPPFAEPIPGGPSTNMLQEEAERNKIVLIGGSVPERDEKGKIYNCCVVYGPTGNVLGKHRKVHLFDIHIPGKISFQESKTLSAGNEITVVETDFCKIGVAICYDIRFSELSLLMAKQGCQLLCFPGAFNMTTGPAHWELLQRSRALDNQLYVATISPARNPTSSYQAWGHSSVVNPWGDVIATTGHEPDIVFTDIDLSRVEQVRQQIPVYQQKRHDLYEVVQK